MTNNVSSPTTVEVLYTKEPITFDLLKEMVPLLQSHWSEVARWQDKIKLKPDWDRYVDRAKKGEIIAYTVREDGLLFGYLIFFIGNHIHYTETLWANMDVLFIHPLKRKGTMAARLIRYAEKDLKKMGVHVIGYHIKTSHDIKPLMNRLGYDDTEKIYTKYVGE